jgi:uncharacterized Zn finger protein (UPF0148 family)
MRCARTFAGLSIACAVAWAPPRAAAALQEGAAEPPPSAIEEALIERACGAMHPAGSLETPAYLECRQTQLLSLRNDFGRDLRRLSTAQRKTIDAACSGLRESQGQDAYVACVNVRLIALRPHASGGKAGASVVTPESSASPAGPPSPVLPASLHASRWWIAPALLALVVAGAGGAIVVLRARRAPGACRTCGVTLVEHGELCPTCRHEAADVRRRASAERADEERAREEEQRRQTALDEGRRQQRAREEEDRRRELEEAQQPAQQDEAQRAHEGVHQPSRTDSAATEDEFDPYAALGLPAGASLADIEASYQAARAKYDLDLVADLGTELQQHFQTKRQLIERAYEALATGRPE